MTLPLSRFAIALVVLCLTAPARAFDDRGSHPLAASGTVQVLFSPWHDAQAALVELIRSARQSIRIQAYVFTSRTLARALLEAHRRGIDVQVLTDAEQLGRMVNSQIPKLAAAGIPVGVEVRYAAAHNKILIVDGDSDEPIVATGSFNFTYSAQARNAENLLILRGNRALARRYVDNWVRHKIDAVSYAEIMPRR